MNKHDEAQKARASLCTFTGLNLNNEKEHKILFNYIKEMESLENTYQLQIVSLQSVNTDLANEIKELKRDINEMLKLEDEVVVWHYSGPSYKKYKEHSALWQKLKKVGDEK